MDIEKKKNIQIKFPGQKFKNKRWIRPDNEFAWERYANRDDGTNDQAITAIVLLNRGTNNKI